MATKTMGARDADFLLSESAGSRSRESVTILSGENLEGGSVLGKVTASGKYVLSDADAVDGSEAAAAVLLNAVDASAGDSLGTVIVRDAEVDTDKLVWDALNDAGEKTTALAELLALGIVAR